MPISVAQNDLLRLFSWHHLAAPVQEPRCQFVVAGSYSISNSTPGYLTTAPGAGVGVAIYDKSAGVGGVAHFLLAEPTAGVGVRRRDYYVSTALPEFIEALLAAGASLERLAAAVAGGSYLVEDLSDANTFSLGTQVVTATIDILQQQKIPVTSIEVGGLRPLSLLLDTLSWKTSIQFIGGPSNQPRSDVNKPSALEIKQAIDAVTPIPQIALKIIQLLGRDNCYSVTELADEIKRDQVVAAKILRYSNSAFFSPESPVESIERAIVLLGEKNLLEVAVSTAAEMFYSGHEGGYSLMRGGLYRHALATAHTAKEIALFTGWVDAGTAYTAGLLHDIGKVVLDRFVADSLPLFYQQYSRISDFTELERERFGIDHMQAGQQLATKWQFPDSLCAAISSHHRPEQAPEAHQLMAHILYLADLLASVYMSGVDLEQVTLDHLNTRMERIGLRPDQLSLIIAHVPWNKLLYL
ncbi:MAG TPA: HDOD domain-containing protein [Malonomonas sp.]